MKRYILCIVFALVCFGLFTTQSIAEEKIKDKEIAIVVMWFTANGLPQNIFIVDFNHIFVKDNVIIIDRTPHEKPVDQILRGGMFDIQSFGYYELFDPESGRLKQQHLMFAARFKQKANEHLGLEKTKEGF